MKSWWSELLTHRPMSTDQSASLLEQQACRHFLWCCGVKSSWRGGSDFLRKERQANKLPLWIDPAKKPTRAMVGFFFFGFFALFLIECPALLFTVDKNAKSWSKYAGIKLLQELTDCWSAPHCRAWTSFNRLRRRALSTLIPKRNNSPSFNAICWNLPLHGEAYAPSFWGNRWRAHSPTGSTLGGQRARHLRMSLLLFKQHYT